MFSGLPYSYLSLYTLVSGTLLSVSSLHWFGVWAGLEVNLIGFLPLIVYQKGMTVSEAAVKYFIVQALGSAFLIVGSLSSSSVDFLWSVGMLGMFSSWGCVLVVLSLLMKMGAFPFQFWLPGVMAGLNWFPCLLLATWQKIAPLFMISFFMSSMYLSSFILMLCVVSAMSSIVGGIGGINQTQVRSLLAYSSISHMGWMVFGLLQSYEVMKFYFFVYAFINVWIFLGLWGVDSNEFKSISGIFKDKFYGSLVLGMLVSLAGLPPLLGFVPKWSVIVSSMFGGLWGLNLVLILGSLLGIFYYLSLFMYGWLSLNGGVSLRYWAKMSLVLVAGVGLNLLGGLGLILGIMILNCALIIFY